MDQQRQDGIDLLLRVSFETDLPRRVERAVSIALQEFIPAHWFSAAASECAAMYVDGHFYGCISVAQAYTEALSRYLIEHHRLRGSNSNQSRWNRLGENDVITGEAREAAQRIISDRNDFHHLNRDVESDYFKLEHRAQACVNDVNLIEGELFGYSISESGALSLKNPQYWPRNGSLAQVHLRKAW